MEENTIENLKELTRKITIEVKRYREKAEKSADIEKRLFEEIMPKLKAEKLESEMKNINEDISDFNKMNLANIKKSEYMSEKIKAELNERSSEKVKEVFEKISKINSRIKIARIRHKDNEISITELLKIENVASNNIEKLQNELKEWQKENSKLLQEVQSYEKYMKDYKIELEGGERAELYEIEPAKPEPAKPESAKPEPAKPEPAKPEPAKPEPAKPEPAKPEPAKSEPAKPEPAKPVANTPKIRLDAKLGKLYYNDGTNEHEAGIEYPKKYWKNEKILNIIEGVTKEYGVRAKIIAKFCDPNIINVLENNPEMLKKYVVSMYEENELPFEISYNLKDIYDVDFLTNREKSYMNRVAKKSEELNAEVNRDSLKDRAFGWIKSHISKATRTKAVEENKKKMLNSPIEKSSEDKNIYSKSKEYTQITEFKGTAKEFNKFIKNLVENKKIDFEKFRDVINEKFKEIENLAKADEKNKKNPFKETLVKQADRVRHFTSKKIDRLKMHRDIAGVKIGGYFKGRNPVQREFDAAIIRDVYTKKGQEK